MFCYNKIISIPIYYKTIKISYEVIDMLNFNILLVVSTLSIKS